MDDFKIEAMLLWAFAIMGITASIIACAFPRPGHPVKPPQKVENAGNYVTPWWVHAPEKERHGAMRMHLDSICNGLK